MSTDPSKNENTAHPSQGRAGITWLAYLVLGVFFGITLTKSEVLSWFRIQEMFRFTVRKQPMQPKSL